MIVPVPFRYDLTGLDPPATPSGQDAEVQLNPSLIQSLELCGATLDATPSGTTVMLKSFLASLTVDIAPSAAAADNNVIALGKAFWELTLTLSFLGNFTPAGISNAANTVAINLISPTAQTFTVLSAHLASTFPIAIEQQIRLLLTGSPWQVQLHTPPTGAAQNITARAIIIGRRLL